MLYNFEQLSFQILTIDRFFHQNGLIEVQARPYAALSYRVSGTGDFTIDGRKFFISPGDILFIPANMPYRVDYSVSESIVANLNDCNYPDAETFSFRNPAECELCFQRLMKEWKETHSANRAKSAIYDILERLDNDSRASTEATAFDVCLQYIDAHYCEPSLDIASICRDCFVSPSSLHRAFVRYFGIPPKQYITKLRMNKALNLLAENRHTVKEIAYLCGFEDEKYFSRLFSGKYGYPPSKLLGNISL